MPNPYFPAIWNCPLLSQNLFQFPMLPFSCTNPVNWLVNNPFSIVNNYRNVQLPLYPLNQPLIPTNHVQNIDNHLKKTSNNIIIVDE